MWWPSYPLLLHPGILAGQTELQHLEARKCSIQDGSAGAAQLLSELQTLQQFVTARAAHVVGGQRSQVRAMLDRAILKLLKTLRQIQETHPW